MDHLRAILVWACLVGLLLPSGVSAQVPAEAFGLSWDAPAGCPGERVVLEEIEYLTATSMRAEFPALRATATVRRDGDRWRLVMETQIGEATGHRELRAVNCLAIARVAALMVALLLDPLAVAAAPVRPAESPTAPLPGPSEPAGTVTGSAVNAAPELGSEPPGPAAEPLRPPPPPLELEPPPPVEPPPPPRPEPEPEPESEPDPGGDAPALRGTWSLYLAGVADLGSMPGLAFGIEAGAGWARNRLRLGAGLRSLPIASADLEGSPGFGANLGLFAGFARVGADWIAGPGYLAPYLELESGFFRASGFGVSDPRTSSVFWMAIGPGLEGGYRISERFQLNGGVGVLVPLRRFAFRLNDIETVHEVASLVLRLSVSLAVHFR